MIAIHTQRQKRTDERGQILVIFGVVLLALIAMVGLILDGGSAFAQRRSQQNAADLAAMAGANAYVLTNDTAVATSAAKAVAGQNGWPDATNGIKVSVAVDTTNGASVTVDVVAPHHNNFGAIIGLVTMEVGTTATALSGFPDSAEGAAPMTFSIDAFDNDGNPLPAYSNPSAPFHFGDTNSHAPTGPSDFAWTNYGTGNVNTNEVRQIIQGNLVISKTLDFGEYIGQHNNGNHTALFGEVNTHLSGLDVPVPIVDSNGNFQGWATFHIVSAQGGSAKDVVGYFLSSFVSQRLTIGGCEINDCPRYLGTYVLKLIN